MKKWAILAAGAALLLAAVPVFAQGGFNEVGYNYGARNFVGTGSEWCQGKLGMIPSECDAYMDPYHNDHLKMKWSKAWDDARFYEGEWTCDAWEDNEWNGMFPGGSGETWHYKIVWVGSDLATSECWREGGYPIWGEFEVIMSHGTVGGEHIWETLAEPAGYGGF